MEKIINVKGNKNKAYFYYDSFDSVDKAMKVVRLYQKEDNVNYSIQKDKTYFLVKDRWNVYFDKISPLNNGVIFTR